MTDPNANELLAKALPGPAWADLRSQVRDGSVTLYSDASSWIASRALVAMEQYAAQALAAERADMPTIAHFFDRPGGPPGNYERPMTAKEARETIAMFEAEVAKLSAPVDDDALRRVARLLCEQHGGDPDAVAAEPHDCWEGQLWTAFTSDAAAVIAAIAAGRGEQ